MVEGGITIVVVTTDVTVDGGIVIVVNVSTVEGTVRVKLR
jgi:hypothetical protein